MDCWRFGAVLIAAGCWLVAEPAYSQSMPAEVISTAPKLTITEADEVLAIVPGKSGVVDPYAAVGIKLGGIVLHPSLTIGPAATSNLLQASSGAKSAIGIGIQPSLDFESDWVRHSWTGTANFDVVRYFDEGDVKSQSGDVFSRFRLDIRRDTRAEFEAGYVLDQTGLGNSEVPLNAVGLQTQHVVAGAMALIHDFGPLETRIRAGAGWNIYDDVKLAGGGSEDNSDRDYIEPLVSVRATFTGPPVFKPYLQANYMPRHYQQKYDRNGLQRSSQGYGAAAGLVIDNGPLWSGDIALTYLWRDYKDPTLNNNSALGFIGSLAWSPTELTTLVLAMGTSLPDSVSATTSGFRDWTGQLDLTYAVRENVDLLAGVGVTLEKGGATDDVTYDVNFGADWKLSRSLAWTAGYDFTWLNASASDRSYTEHQLWLGLRLSR